MDIKQESEVDVLSLNTIPTTISNELPPNKEETKPSVKEMKVEIDQSNNTNDIQDPQSKKLKTGQSDPEGALEEKPRENSPLIQKQPQIRNNQLHRQKVAILTRPQIKEAFAFDNSVETCRVLEDDIEDNDDDDDFYQHLEQQRQQQQKKWQPKTLSSQQPQTAHHEPVTAPAGIVYVPVPVGELPAMIAAGTPSTSAAAWGDAASIAAASLTSSSILIAAPQIAIAPTSDPILDEANAVAEAREVALRAKIMVEQARYKKLAPNKIKNHQVAGQSAPNSDLEAEIVAELEANALGLAREAVLRAKISAEAAKYKSIAPKRRKYQQAAGKLIQCKMCGEWCRGKDTLEKHVQRHYAQQLHKCHKCGAEHESSEEFLKHLKEIHNKHLKNQHTAKECAVCGVQYHRRHYLLTHVRKMHKLEICEFCYELYSTKEQLEEHQKSCGSTINMFHDYNLSDASKANDSSVE